jgi:transporter family-2 protein
MRAGLIGLTILAASFLTIQAGVNAKLSLFVGGAVRATLISFVLGTLVALVLFLVVPGESHLPVADAPWWAWLGGILGTLFVFTAIVAAPRLGAASYVALVVAAQLTTSVVLDHFGWIGFAERQLSALRVLGVVLLLGGALLVRLY